MKLRRPLKWFRRTIPLNQRKKSTEPPVIFTDGSALDLFSGSILTTSLLHDDLSHCIQVHRQLVLSCGQCRRGNRLDLILGH